MGEGLGGGVRQWEGFSWSRRVSFSALVTACRAGMGVRQACLASQALLEGPSAPR